MFTAARHWSPSRARRIKFLKSHPISLRPMLLLFMSMGSDYVSELRPLTGILFILRMIRMESHGGMIFTEENRRTRRKTCPSPNLFTNPTPTKRARRPILISSFHLCLRLPIGLFPSAFPSETKYALPTYPIRRQTVETVLLNNLRIRGNAHVL
jgi:hypothetical protein